MPYPEHPYYTTTVAVFPSGGERDLVRYGEPCDTCASKRTYLDGGAASCLQHLTPICKHGNVACVRCGKFKRGVPTLRRIAKRLAR